MKETKAACRTLANIWNECYKLLKMPAILLTCTSYTIYKR